MRSTKPKPKLTRAEIAAALKRRAAADKRKELGELVALAYEIGRKTSRAEPIPPGRLISRLKELRAARAASKTSKKAARWLALLDPQPATMAEIKQSVDELLQTAKEGRSEVQQRNAQLEQRDSSDPLLPTGVETGIEEPGAQEPGRRMRRRNHD
jgi:hypothetical protein